MKTLEKAWAWYLLLPLWKQALFFLPVLLGAVVWIICSIPATILNPNPAPVDVLIKDHQKEDAALKKEAGQIAGEIAAIRQETETRHEDLQATMDRIDAATPNELSAIAAELRAEHQRLIAGIASRNRPDGGK
jgi:hypothetical protein